jgi:Zn-dependent M28 family amino/carboxypeptidase
MRVVQSNTREYAPDLEINLSDNSFGSDHVSFQRAGIPAILGIELDDTNYPHYHRVTDTVRKTRRSF